MPLTCRRYESGEDYWRIRAFLRAVFMRNERRAWSWDLPRWDYCRWHAYENVERLRPEDAVLLWETSGGELAAVLNAEGRGEAFLQVHPDHRSTALEEEMIAVAEERLAVARDGARHLTVWAHQADNLRPAILARRGYRRGEWPEYQRRRALTGEMPFAPIPHGYTVRALAGDDELPARSWASWRGFHPDDPPERYRGWEWYRNVQRCPLYRRDLDLVAVAPDGSIASFCTVWFDDVTRIGVFEPVATVPEHLRRGLARATMTEGLRRLQRLGATLATVGSYSEGAGATYASVGFVEYDLLERWETRL